MIKVFMNDEYFINKFESIPDEQWTTGAYEYFDCHCALGHCGVRIGLDGVSAEYTREGFALTAVFLGKLEKIGMAHLGVPNVNDGDQEAIRLGETPKERVMKVLQSTPEELFQLLSYR